MYHPAPVSSRCRVQSRTVIAHRTSRGLLVALALASVSCGNSDEGQRACVNGETRPCGGSLCGGVQVCAEEAWPPSCACINGVVLDGSADARGACNQLSFPDSSPRIASCTSQSTSVNGVQRNALGVTASYSYVVSCGDGRAYAGDVCFLAYSAAGELTDALFTIGDAVCSWRDADRNGLFTAGEYVASTGGCEGDR